MIPSPLATALSSRYRIERELGAGGMATVYLAEDLKHRRPVAIKVLHPEVAGSVGPERFLREIEIAAGLHHPHILPLYDSGESGGFLFYVMPYVEGESLARKLTREGELPVIDAVRILRDVADALAKAHAQGVVHRDIKPDNVLLADRHALVADFGVARAVTSARETATLTGVGVALGTPAYMAPEQAAADPNVDHRADIYAFGCMAYEMLAGVPPFTGHSAPQILAAHITTTPVPVTEHRPAVPALLAQLVRRCLEKKPADRPQSAAELVTELEAILTPGGTAATHAHAAPTVAPPRGRRSPPSATVPARTRAVAFSALAGVAMLASGWFIVSRIGGSQALDPNLVVVLPFRISGGDAEVTLLREGMLDLMATYLSGEGGTPRAADPGTVMAAWRRRVPSEGADLEEREAQEVGREIGAGRVLTGSIVQSGDRLIMRGTLVPVGGVGSPTQAHIEGPVDSLMALLPRFVGQVLAQSVGVAADVSASLTTGSLPALRAYLRGQAEYRRARYGAAVNRFTEALENDSTFALAGLGLLAANGWTGSAATAIVGIARRAAWNGRSLLSVRDRALVVAALGPNGLEPSTRREFLSAREQAVDVAGDRADAWYYLGDEYFHQGALLGLDDALIRAEEALRRSVARDSTVSGPLEHLQLIAAIRGDTAEVRRLLVHLERTADPSSVHRFRWLTGIFTRDSGLVAQAQATMDTTTSGDVLQDGGQFLLPFVYSRTPVLRELMTRYAERAVTQEERRRRMIDLAMLEYDLGRPRQAASRLIPADDPALAAMKLQAALFWSGDSTTAADAARFLASTPAGNLESATFAPPFVCTLGLWYVHSGELGRAQRTVTGLRERAAGRDPRWPPSHSQVCALVIEAIVAQREGRPNVAQLVDSLDRTLLTVPYRPLSWENLAVARLLENRGEFARAASAARRHMLLYGPLPFYTTHLREAGRLSELAGDTARAIEAYTKYLAIRYDPESAIAPEVADIRQRLERLTSEARAARK